MTFPRQIRTLREIANDEKIYLHAKYYLKGTLEIPVSKDGGLVTFADCLARTLNTGKNPYAEISEEIYLCSLMDAVRHMYGDRYSRSSAFCLRNLACGCCPHGFPNPLSFSEEPQEELPIK